ncbi:hypothetical protein D3C83_235220 [compost metagenome]
MDEDLPRLQRDEEPRVARVRDGHRAVEPGDDLLQRDLRFLRARGRREKENENERKVSSHTRFRNAF